MSRSGLRPRTSESVTEGHPDKLADRVSDAILDAVLDQDPQARVAVETVATKGLVGVVGELTTNAYVEIPQIVRDEITSVGYDSQAAGFDGNSCGVSISIGQQSPEIASGVTQSLQARGGSVDPREAQGAGDQGIMFGYATDETKDLMPAPLWLAHRLAERLADVRHSGLVEGIYPDGKTQATLLYDGDKPVALDNIVVSTQHLPSLNQADLEEAMRAHVIAPVLAESGLDLDDSSMRLLVNPSGSFTLGGPAADAGLTGRKIIVDTYGGAAPHGGGAFSGKDPSKVDRSAAYAARWIAKTVVAAGLAKRCQVELAYAIGSAHPVAVMVKTFGTGVVPDEQLEDAIQEVFDLRPLGIIEDLGLLDTSRLKYKDTSAYGHFGRPQFAWEDTSRKDDLRLALGANL